MSDKFDVIIVGTGFASSFFLIPYLEKTAPSTRILVLERGRLDTHSWQVQNRRTSSQNENETFINTNPQKKWVFNLGFGGGSNCWWGVTPRMLPNDFRTHSLYGVGVDWPVQYDELEKFYTQAENIMSISGPDDGSPFPRSEPYPQPPHNFTDPDRVFKASYPQLFFHQPTSRARLSTTNRPRCCATGTCSICPANAKFTILNELNYLYEDPRLTLVLEASVQTIQTQAGIATGVTYIKNGTIHEVQGDLIVLGANALFNPHILHRSNIQHAKLGKYLNEQISVDVIVDLDGLDNFQGSTSLTCHGYMLYDGEHRRDYAGCLMETWNVPMIRTELGKWQQRLRLKFIYENLPLETNYINFDTGNPNLPETVFPNNSDYALKGVEMLPTLLPQLLNPLPVENIHFSNQVNRTESHILGTTVMGSDPETSIIDEQLVHHQIRNLLVLGGGAFPSVVPANPTLTISALSLWAAHHLLN